MREQDISRALDALKDRARNKVEEAILEFVDSRWQEMVEELESQEGSLNITTEEAREKIEDHLLETEQIYEKYSGRGMYGVNCLGVVCPHSRIGFWQQLFEEKVSIDNMGLDMIIYWQKFSTDEAKTGS
jgi:hypothetical protein